MKCETYAKIGVTGLLITWLIFNIIVAILTIPSLFKPKYNVYDVNHDGVVDMKDTTEIQKYIVEEQLSNAPEGGFITVTGVRTK